MAFTRRAGPAVDLADEPCWRSPLTQWRLRVVDHNKESAGDGRSATQIRAAEYVRMSTEHQQYSTANQAAVIRQYATRRGHEVVRTYADEGKSGLSLDGRKALKRLIADVQSGNADYEVILVYDVSRWGRFQDSDESAYYEHICKRAGIVVQYCAEQFENDGGLGSTLLKSVKRVMAGEYSRELSEKVFAGQSRLITLGFRQGGPAGFGLRRQLLDHTGAPKGILARGEQKSIQTDRVVLAPGPDGEVEIVRWIHRAFVDERRTESEIASMLNGRGICTDLGRQWTRGTVHQVLINEKYAGDNVWNRRSFKLKQKRVRNTPDKWIRAHASFQPIIEPNQFAAAQDIIAARSQRLSDESMLAVLRQILVKHDWISGIVIDETEGAPSSSAYRSRFGSLLRAYQLIGHTPLRDYRYIAINRVLRLRHADVIADIVRGIEHVGGDVVRDAATDLLSINSEFTASIVVARCRQTTAGSLRWHVRLDSGLQPDISVAVRMDASNEFALDYYLLPRIDVSAPRLSLARDNGIELDAYRFDTLNPFYELAARTSILKVA